MANSRKRFKVDYTYGKSSGGSQHRTQLVSSNVQLPMMATSETAVLGWLKKKHIGCEITIIALDWFDN